MRPEIELIDTDRLTRVLVQVDGLAAPADSSIRRELYVSNDATPETVLALLTQAYKDVSDRIDRARAFGSPAVPPLDAPLLDLVPSEDEFGFEDDNPGFEQQVREHQDNIAEPLDSGGSVPGPGNPEAYPRPAQYAQCRAIVVRQHLVGEMREPCGYNLSPEDGCPNFRQHLATEDLVIDTLKET